MAKSKGEDQRLVQKRSVAKTFVYKNALIRTFTAVFDYKITFVNSQHKNTDSKGDFILKTRFETFVLKFSSILKLIGLRYGMTNSINKHLRLVVHSNNTHFYKL